ncbi:acyl carrier protein [Streptomyces sp. NPDC059003]|uniref:acyl carrier protein n=1 Tax=Streptomyces sp. NPDC059003 TaxID=3346691 RepID=UPI0036AF67B2
MTGSTTPRDLDLDSLKIVELAMRAQSELGIEIGEDDITSDLTLDQMQELLRDKRRQT